MAESDPVRDTDAILSHALDIADDVGLDLEDVIVFGSVATGNATPASDVDLILVSRDFEDTPFIERANEYEFDWDRKYGTPDVTPVTPSEFETRRDDPDDIIAIALDEGDRLSDAE